MVRTNKSVVDLYRAGQWTPLYTTTNSTAGWLARILKTRVSTIGIENKVTVTYICKEGATIVSAGYVYFDYKQDAGLTTPPTTTLIHKYTDGDSSLLNWVVSVYILTTPKNEQELFVKASRSGLTVEFSVEATDISQVVNVFNNIVFSNNPTLRDTTPQVLSSNDIWQYNDNLDIYNTNATGRVGINTGPSMTTTAMLDVNGNVHFRGLMSLQYPGSDLVFIDSASDLGYDFRVFNMTDSAYRLYIDDNGQVGINTNAPRNMLHVVGGAQITDCVSIGAGNSPVAKLEVRGQGNTHDTTALLIKNSDDHDLFRVYDDCAVEFCGVPFDPTDAITCDDLIFTNLPIPHITNTWTATSEDGSPYNPPSLGESTENNFTVVEGARVDFSGTYKYVINPSNQEVEPDRIAGDWGTTIPGSGIPSAVLDITDIQTTTTIEVTLYKQRSGLIIEDGQVVCPLLGVEDETRATATITFANSYYFGYTLAAKPDVSEVQLLLKDDKYLTSRQQTQVGVDPIGEQYTVYAYPKKYGKLDDVILNGASSILGAFNMEAGPLMLENHAGRMVECYVYVSNAMDAFTDDELKFL